jgi:hypothetical protein
MGRCGHARRQRREDLQIRTRLARGRNDRLKGLHPAFQAGEGSRFFRKRGARQHHMGHLDRFVAHDVLGHNEVDARQRILKAICPGQAAQRVLAQNKQGFDAAFFGGFDHLRQIQSGIGRQAAVPVFFPLPARGLIAKPFTARQRIRCRTHVPSPDQVVLLAFHVEAGVGGADAAGHQQQVEQAVHARQALRLVDHLVAGNGADAPAFQSLGSLCQRIPRRCRLARAGGVGVVATLCSRRKSSKPFGVPWDDEVRIHGADPDHQQVGAQRQDGRHMAVRWQPAMLRRRIAIQLRGRGTRW